MKAIRLYAVKDRRVKKNDYQLYLPDPVLKIEEMVFVVLHNVSTKESLITAITARIEETLESKVGSAKSQTLENYALLQIREILDKGQAFSADGTDKAVCDELSKSMRRQYEYEDIVIYIKI